MNIKTINLDINKPYYGKVMAKQGDTNSRFLLFHLLDGASQFNLTGRAVRAYAIKQDGSIVFNDLIINDATKGFCTLELTSQLLALPGIVKIELYITENTKKLTSIPFELEVIACINSDAAVVSTNEFTALLRGLASLQEYDAFKAEWNNFKNGGGKIGDIYIKPYNDSRYMISTVNKESIEFGIIDELNNLIGGFGLVKSSTSHCLAPWNVSKNIMTLGLEANPFKDIFLTGSLKDNNGYTKLPNGFILQWGRAKQSSASGNTVQVTFPIAFPVKMLCPVAIGIAVNPNDNFWMRSDSDYKTYCSFRKNATAQIIDEFHWIAIGY